MAFDVISYALSKRYTDNSIAGGGISAGKNCQISSITDITGGHRVTFKWYLDNGTEQTRYMDVMNGEDGDSISFSITNITRGHRVTITSTDGTSNYFDVMDGVGVQSVDINANNHMIVTYTDGTTHDAGVCNLNVDDELSPTSENPVQNKVITAALDDKVDKVAGKGLSTNDFTNGDKNKLDNIENNAQANVIEAIYVNGTQVTVVDKEVFLTILTASTTALQNYYLKTQTYTKEEVQELIGSAVGVTIQIVETLPTTGQSNVIYFLPTDTPNVYSQYIYTAEDGWVLIGSTTVDLSNYYTKTQVDTLLNAKQDTLTFDAFPQPMSENPAKSGGIYTAINEKQSQLQYTTLPTASVSNFGLCFQYTGASGGQYEQGYWYVCKYNSGTDTYYWATIGSNVTVDQTLNVLSENAISNKAVTTKFNSLFDDTQAKADATFTSNKITTELAKKQDVMQFATMPLASDYQGKIVEFTGSSTATLKNGYFYKSVYDSGESDYVWSEVKFGTDITIDNAMSTTSENPVQNKVVDAAIKAVIDDTTSAVTSTYSSDKIDDLLDTKINTSAKGVANGVAELDNTGKVPSAQLPSYVDDTVEGYLHNNRFYEDDQYTTEIPAESGKIYVDLATNKIYRWSGTVFVEISESLALGETSTTAYRGDRGKEAYDIAQTVGDVANLTTTDKTTVVGAINEIDAEVVTKQNIIQVSDLGTASAANVGKIYQYIGSTTSTYTNGWFYRCDAIGGTYVWDAIEFGAVGDFLEKVNALPTATAGLVGTTYLLNDAQTGYVEGGIYKCKLVDSTPTWVLISASGGSNVTVTQTVTDTNCDPVADIGVDGVSTTLYAPQRELTQAQYDALTNAEKMNGTAYYIIDSEGSFTDNYNSLLNKPQIGGTTLEGNKTLAQLGIQGTLEYDTIPTVNSEKLIKSGDLYETVANDLKGIKSTSQTLSIPTHNGLALIVLGNVNGSGNSALGIAWESGGWHIKWWSDAPTGVTFDATNATLTIPAYTRYQIIT